MKPPIILIGTHRSGTTWFGDILSRHSSLAYWVEPRHIWSWGNNYKSDDELAESDASPVISHHIRQRFELFVHDQKKKGLFEKTPSNCLRIPFILKIFPDAKFIHVARDGRAVLKSTIARYNRPESNTFLSTRMKNLLRDTQVIEWPAYLPTIKDTLISKVTGKPLSFWGPRPSGWLDWVKNDPQDVVVAKQWAALVIKSVEDVKKIPNSQYYRFNY